MVVAAVVAVLFYVPVKTLPLQLTSLQLIQFQLIHHLTLQWFQAAMILLHLVYLQYLLWSFVIRSKKVFCNYCGFKEQRQT